jgi:hypothetical protein
MRRRARPLALAAALLLASLLAAGALAASGRVQGPPSAVAVVALGAAASPGIQIGPPPAGSTPPAAPTTTVPGDQASHPAFWDLPGRVRQAINDWFRGLVLDALTPTLDLVGRTVLSTPGLASNPQIAGLWQISLIAADALLVLCLILGAGLAMSHETMQSRYALKDLVRRLVFAGIAANASLSLIDQLGTVANALASAFLGDGASAASAGASLQNFVVGGLAGGGIFVTLLGLACAVAAVALLILYLLRAALIVMLACAAPLVLLCHLFPQSEGLAQLWWRALAAAFGIQVTQALVLAACVRVFFAGGGGGLGLAVGGSVVNLLLCLCLLVVLVRIPFWAKELAFGSRGSAGTRLATTYVISRLGRAAA